MKKTLLLIAMLCLSLNAQLWRGQTINPPYRLNDVDFQADLGMAVGEGGAVFIKIGASPWQIFRTGAQTEWLNSVDIHGSQAWAVGENGVVLKFEFNSQTWSQIQLNTSENLKKVYFAGPDIGYIVGYGSTLFKTTNAGATWTRQNFNSSDYQLTSIAYGTDMFGAMGSLAASATVSRLLVTENGGAGYLPLSLPYVGGIFNISVPNDQVIYAAGEFGLLKSTNRGLSWINLTPNIPGYIYPGDMFFYDTMRGVIVLNNGIIHKTTDGGATWSFENVFPFASNVALGIYTQDLENIHVVGYGQEQAWERRTPIELSLDNVALFSGDTVKIPLRIKNPNSYPLFSGQIYLNNFSPKLKFIGVKPDVGTLMNTSGWSFYTNQTNENLRFISYGSDYINTNGILCYLQFKATPADPTKRDSVFISFDSAYFNTNNYPVFTKPGRVLIKTRFPGDVDLNGVVQAFDASMVLRYLVNQITLDEEQLGNAEVTNNTTITAADASTIAQYVAGLIPSLPWGNFPQAAGTPQIVDVNAPSGQIIEVPVFLNNPENLYTLQGNISFDAGAFNFEGLQFAPQFSGALREVRNEDGVVKFAVASLQEVPLTPGVPAFKLRLSYNGSLNSSQSSVSFTNFRLNENIFIPDAGQSIIHIITGITGDENIPLEFALKQNYPNPFNPSTMIAFALPKASFVSLIIYNSSGEKVTELINRHLEAGYHEIGFSAADLPSGIYLYKLTAGNNTSTRKMILMK
ncbi:MAG: T9SS type A sorting domain-containing protein [Bacteroidetes bacterium]|nr:T9SS type A sorting domain-containing protein [Bacteroidota bacterium]